MAYTHVITQSVVTPEGILGDTGTTKTADTSWSLSGVVPANGQSANAIIAAFPETIQSAVFLASVPCVVTLTGATAIDGTSTSAVTLAAGAIRTVSTVVGAITAISVGANTTSSGAAGTITISVIYNS